MGLFSRLKKNVKASVGRNDDKPGTYLQRIDAITEEATEDGKGYVKVHKTTLAVLENADGRAHDPGEETSHTYWEDSPKYQNRYLTRDLKILAKILFGMEQAEADNLEFEDLERILVKENKAKGLVIEHKVWEVVDAKQKNDDGNPKTYTRFKVVRVVPVDELVDAGVIPAEAAA